MSYEKPILTDFIDQKVLQQLQNRISKVADVSTIILDPYGRPIMGLTNPKEICRLPGGANFRGGVCQRIKDELCRMAHETKEPAAMTCPFSGMRSVSVPIFLDNIFLGAWIIEPFRLHGDPTDTFKQALYEAEMDSAAAQKLLEDIPVFSPSEFKMIVDFVSIMTEEMIRQSSFHKERISNLSAELDQISSFDQTLQIPNAERMEQDIRKGGIHKCLVAVAFADLHRFNNLFGRACGDALLKAARDYILDMNIPNSTLYRGQANDFYILLDNTEGNPGLPGKIAEKIHDRCKKGWDIIVGNDRQHIFADACVCVFPLNGDHENFLSYLSSVMEYNIDIARKTDSVVIHDDKSWDSLRASLRLEISLRNSVREGMGGFSVVYQPIVDIGKTMWKGVEALCRWNSPELGSVPPSVFIPLAEASGLIGAIGLWVLEQSVIQIKSWGLDRIEGFLLEVNLSPVQLSIPNLDQTIIDLLRKYDYPSGKLGLEITESSEFNFSQHTMDVIVRLNDLGVVIVLDDFGTGYSSFNSLHKLPVKVLKTDPAFIIGMESDSHLQKLLCAMVTLAHGTNMKLVAEGVENDLQAKFLLNQGADFSQGFFFSPPLTVPQLTEKLNNFYYPVEHLVSMKRTKWGLPDLNEDRTVSREYGLTPRFMNC